MTRAWVIAAAIMPALLCAACGKSESQLAEDRYNVAVGAITGGNSAATVPEFQRVELLTEECRRGREVQEAALREGNTALHRMWKDRTDMACLTAQVTRENERSYP